MIIGAGAAGIGAARRANELGLTCVVIEAASRVGGRAVTVALSSGQPFDLGCHWLQGGARNPFHSAAQSSAVLGPLIRGHRLWADGAFSTAAGSMTLDRAFEELADLHLHCQGRAAANRSAGGQSIRDALCGELAFAEEYFRLLTHECAAEPERVSISDPAGVNFGGNDIPVLSGYGQLISSFADSIDVIVNCPARNVDLSGVDMIIDTPKGSLRTRHAILTVSTAVLANEHISFGASGLPNWKLNAIEGVPMGSATKVGLQLKAGTLARLGLTHVDVPDAEQLVIVKRQDAANGSWHLATGDGDLCTCYIGGQFSRELALDDRSAQIAWAKEDLKPLLGDQIVNDVEAVEATPFDCMENLGGGYSYLRTGYPQAREELARPVDDRLYFAGEACAGIDATTAHGAWNSGVRAVDQICAHRSARRTH